MDEKHRAADEKLTPGNRRGRGGTSLTCSWCPEALVSHYS